VISKFQIGSIDGYFVTKAEKNCNEIIVYRLRLRHKVVQIT